MIYSDNITVEIAEVGEVTPLINTKLSVDIKNTKAYFPLIYCLSLREKVQWWGRQPLWESQAVISKCYRLYPFEFFAHSGRNCNSRGGNLSEIYKAKWWYQKSIDWLPLVFSLIIDDIEVGEITYLGIKRQIKIKIRWIISLWFSPSLRIKLQKWMKVLKWGRYSTEKYKEKSRYKNTMD